MQRPYADTKRLTLGLNSYQDIKQAHSTSIHTSIPTPIHTAIHTPNTRSLSTFLEDQQKFLTNKMRNIALLRRQKEQMEAMQCTNTPTIDPMSHHLSQRLQRQSTFLRLSQQPPQPHLQTTLLFTPKILSKSKSLHRKENVSELLYDDARRRQQKEALLSDEKSRRTNASPAINHNTNALVEKKLYAQFTQLVSTPTINPLIALTVLCQLFHLTIQKDTQYCERLLSFLRTKGCVETKRLWAFIQIILHGDSKEETYSSQEKEQIITTYQHFYQVRLTKERKVQSPSQPSFKPKTLVSSRKMAEVHRERVCEAVNEFVTEQHMQLNIKNNTIKIEDLFIIDDLKRKASNEQRRIEKETKELEQCSFKPNLKDSSITLKNLKKKPKIRVTLQSRKRLENSEEEIAHKDILHQDIVNKDIAHKDIVHKDIVQIAHKDTIQKENKGRSASHKKKKSMEKVRDIDKVVLRLSVGRKNREYENKVHARGYTQDQNYQEYKRETHKDVIESHRKLKGY